MADRVVYFICKYCRQRFLDMPNLTAHKRETHLDEILNRKRAPDPAAVITEGGSEPSCTGSTKLLEDQNKSEEPEYETKARSNGLSSLSVAPIRNAGAAVEQLNSKYFPKQAVNHCEPISNSPLAVHGLAFRCQKCLTSFANFPLLNAHIKSGCPGKKAPTPPPPPPVPAPLPSPPTPNPNPFCKTLPEPKIEVEEYNFIMPVISRSIYDEFYVPSDESPIPSDSDGSGDETLLVSIQNETKAIVKDKTFKYNCKYCGKGAKFLSQNLQHERTHTKSHRCLQCSARFAEVHKLRNHMVKSHGTTPRGQDPTPKFKSKKKKKVLPNPTPTLIHHHEQPPSPIVIPVEPSSTNKIQCPECPSLLKSNENLKIHMRIHNGIKPYACKLCPYKGAQVGQLSYHMKCHTESHEFKCHLCSASYKNEPHLKRHIKHVHEQTEEKIKHDSVAHSVDEIKREKTSQKSSPESSPKKLSSVPEITYTCSSCSKKFKTADLLDAHAAFHLDQKEFICEICEVGFTRKPDLVRHNKSQNHLTALQVVSQTEENGSCNLPRTLSVTTGKVKTSSPSKPKKSSDSLIGVPKEDTKQDQYQTSTSPHPISAPTIKKLRCLICEGFFSTPAALANHVKTHRGDLPTKSIVKNHRGEDGKYQCNICDRIVATSASLKTHMRQHSGEKPYSCQHCGKSFMYQTSFKRHVQSHTGGRAFKCTECTSTFVLKLDLKRHFYRVHVFDEKNKEKSLNSTEFMETEDNGLDGDNFYEQDGESELELGDSDAAMNGTFDHYEFLSTSPNTNG